MWIITWRNYKHSKLATFISWLGAHLLYIGVVMVILKEVGLGIGTAVFGVAIRYGAEKLAQAKAKKCPGSETEAQKQTKKTDSRQIVRIALAIFFVFIFFIVVRIMISSNNKIDLESTNVVESVVEYKINRVFTSDVIGSLLMKETYVDSAEDGEMFVIIDTEVKNLKTTEANAGELVDVKLTINEKEYLATSYIITEDEADEYKTIPSGETARVYYAFFVPEGENTDNMTLKTVCGGKTASCEVSVSTYEARKESLILNNEYTDYSTKSITVEKVWFTDEVKPTDFDNEKYSDYDYWYADPGETLLTVKMCVKNLGNSYLPLNEIAGIECIQGGLEGRYYIEGEKGTTRTIDVFSEQAPWETSIAPQETRTVYCMISVPDSYANSSPELELYLVGTHYYYTVQ